MRSMILMAAMMVSLHTKAQDSVKHASPNPLSFSGYIEAYFSYDLNRPPDNSRPNFLYNYNRHNEFNLNLGFVKATYNTQRVRANVAVGAGTYMNANYAAEPATLQNIYEANAGYKLSKTKNLWFDIGIMPSHIGFETAIGKDNWTLTRSLLAENSPYFESGAKLSYITNNGKLQVAALALNGWQRITRVEGNSFMSFGTQVYAKLTGDITLNYSTFFGTDKPDSARLLRSYHNIYGIFQFTPVVGLTAGFDIGMEEQTPNGSGNNTWYVPVGILRITPNRKWAIALRGEYFSDENGVIIATGTTNGFKTIGGSFNIDYWPQINVALRIEVRHFNSKDAIFMEDGQVKNNNTAISFSTGISF